MVDSEIAVEWGWKLLSPLAGASVAVAEDETS